MMELSIPFLIFLLEHFRMELINDPANLAIVHTGALGDHDNILSSPSGTWQPRWLYWS